MIKIILATIILISFSQSVFADFTTGLITGLALDSSSSIEKKVKILFPAADPNLIEYNILIENEKLPMAGLKVHKINVEIIYRGTLLE